MVARRRQYRWRGLGYGSGMGDSVMAQLGVIAAGEGSRQERAARASDLIRRVTGARWVGIWDQPLRQ